MDPLVSFNGDRDRCWPCLACVRDAAGPVRAGAHVYEPERMHLSLFSNTHSLCWTGATKAMATGPGGARVLAVLFESLPRTPSLVGLCARIPMPCPHDTLACTEGGLCFVPLIKF